MEKSSKLLELIKRRRFLRDNKAPLAELSKLQNEIRETADALMEEGRRRHEKRKRWNSPKCKILRFPVNR